LRINEPTRPIGWVCEVDMTISDIVDAIVAHVLSALIPGAIVQAGEMARTFFLGKPER